jgi:polyisoprenoid-binding protein YceI
MKKTLSLSILIISILFVGGCSLSPNKQNNPSPRVSKVKDTSNASNTANVNSAVEANATSSELNNLSSESSAEFSLNELLRGVPTFVVGTNDQITGKIKVSPTEPAKIDIGEIKLDARTFITDNPMRNKNITELILKSNEPQNQFIVFKTTGISGVPKVLTSGETFPVKITGDLTISGKTKPTTFDGTITWKDDGTLRGLAETSLTYADFGVSLPDFNFFSNVDKAVKLKINIKANTNK